MDIKNVFEAQPKGIWEYFTQLGVGLYIPAYQRQYSWEKPQIQRLIEDICHGFTMLTKKDDAITFLGTIIAIHDSNLTTVYPIEKSELPTKVMTIIDGQQRLTTLLLIITVLHEEIQKRLNKYINNYNINNDWLSKVCKAVLSKLAQTFEEDSRVGDQYFPRMIRAYDDKWGFFSNTAYYKSAIGHYLHTYGKYAHKYEQTKKYEVPVPEMEDFKYELPEQEDSKKHKLLFDGRETIYKLIKKICSCNDRGIVDNDFTDLELPEISIIIESEKFQELLKSEFPKDIINKLLEKNDQFFEELIRLVLFANFVLDRVAITIVTAKNEDYAFDMFESLNTTGAPLTAFETFKPKIINLKNNKNITDTKIQDYVNKIEAYLESSGKNNDKQEKTSRLIVSFALAEKGEKLSLKLSEQRRFLKDTFEKCLDLEHQQKFIRHLFDTASFIKYIWFNDKSENTTICFIEKIKENDDVIMCMDLLCQWRHTITHGLLIRFYSEVRRINLLPKNEDIKEIAINNFINAVKAITAFSVLWRSSRQSTDNIDSHYRKLMVNGYEEVGLKPLAAGKENINESDPEITLDVKKLKKAFLSILKKDGKIGNKDEWVKAISKMPIYGESSSSGPKKITRFILLAAAHDSVPDPNIPGLIIAGKSGTLSLFNVENWKGEQLQTIEHIAPQKKIEGWSEKIYEDRDLINRLGNLTLLPKRENSSLKNNAWSKKRLFYKMLSATTLDELEPLRQEGLRQGVKFSQSTDDLLRESKHLPLLKAIASIEGDWTAELIEQRSIRIAELAWDRIYAWLAE